MIVYDKFWETMKRCGESTYTLINHYNISSGTIDRIRKGQGITTTKLDDFCQIFHCRVEDLITYVEPTEGEPCSPYSCLLYTSDAADDKARGSDHLR